MTDEPTMDFLVIKNYQGYKYVYIYLFNYFVHGGEDGVVSGLVTAIQFVWTVHHTVDHIYCRILAIH